MTSRTKLWALSAGALALSLALAGCGGGGSGTSPGMMPPGDGDGGMPEAISLDGLAGAMAAEGEYVIAAGETEVAGDVTFTCPAGGEDCTVTVDADADRIVVGVPVRRNFGRRHGDGGTIGGLYRCGDRGGRNEIRGRHRSGGRTGGSRYARSLGLGSPKVAGDAAPSLATYMLDRGSPSRIARDSDGTTVGDRQTLPWWITV